MVDIVGAGHCSLDFGKKGLEAVASGCLTADLMKFRVNTDQVDVALAAWISKRALMLQRQEVTCAILRSLCWCQPCDASSVSIRLVGFSVE